MFSATRGVEPHLIPGRVAGHDAVEILRVALRLDQRLPSSRRAGVEIGLHGTRIVVRGHERLGRDGHFMDRAIREIHELLGMSRHEIPVAANVARVRTCSGIARLDGRRKCRIRNRPAQSAVADGLDLPVPTQERQPHLDADVGVRGRRQPRGDATERRQRLEHRSGVWIGGAGRNERARLNGLGGDQRPARERHPREGLARDRCGSRDSSRRAGSSERENGHDSSERSCLHVRLHS